MLSSGTVPVRPVCDHASNSWRSKTLTARLDIAVGSGGCFKVHTTPGGESSAVQAWIEDAQDSGSPAQASSPNKNVHRRRLRRHDINDARIVILNS